MKKFVILLLIALCVLSIGVSAFAQAPGAPAPGSNPGSQGEKPNPIEYLANKEDINPNEPIVAGGGMTTYMHPTQMIGTVRYCVEEIQRLTGLINEAICLNDDISYDAKMAEMASLIMQANSAMADSGIPNKLNLWAVYSQLRQRKGDGCNAGTDPLAHADWAREELDRVGQQIGSIEFDNCPYGDRRVWAAGTWVYGYQNSNDSFDWFLQNHDLVWEVSKCSKNGTIHWDPIDGAYDDEYYDTDIDGNPR